MSRFLKHLPRLRLQGLVASGRQDSSHDLGLEPRTVGEIPDPLACGQNSPMALLMVVVGAAVAFYPGPRRAILVLVSQMPPRLAGSSPFRMPFVLVLNLSARP